MPFVLYSALDTLTIRRNYSIYSVKVSTRYCRVLDSTLRCRQSRDNVANWDSANRNMADAPLCPFDLKLIIGIIFEANYKNLRGNPLYQDEMLNIHTVPRMIVQKCTPSHAWWWRDLLPAMNNGAEMQSTMHYGAENHSTSCILLQWFTPCHA